MMKNSVQVIASDGKPVARGDVVYGVSDGREWRVGKIRPNSKYPVIVSGSDKALKAEWVTHEKPEGR